MFWFKSGLKGLVSKGRLSDQPLFFSLMTRPVKTNTINTPDTTHAQIFGIFDSAHIS